MSNIPDEVFFRIGGILHEARMEECFGKTDFSFRKKWPETLKDYRRQQMAGQPWIDVAIAQVRALVKAGLVITGFFEGLTSEQQKAALEYDGPENHGDPEFLHPLTNGEST